MLFWNLIWNFKTQTLIYWLDNRRGIAEYLHGQIVIQRLYKVQYQAYATYKTDIRIEIEYINKSIHINIYSAVYLHTIIYIKSILIAFLKIIEGQNADIIHARSSTYWRRDIVCILLNSIDCGVALALHKRQKTEFNWWPDRV